jgi:hypothetical protein
MLLSAIVMLGLYEQLKTTAEVKMFWSLELRNVLAGKQGYGEIYRFHLQERTTSLEGQNWYLYRKWRSQLPLKVTLYWRILRYGASNVKNVPSEGQSHLKSLYPKQFVPDRHIFIPSKEINFNPKRRYLYTEAHGVTRDKTGIPTLTAVRNTDPTIRFVHFARRFSL